MNDEAAVSPRRRPTVVTLAALAGVAPSTVSRALNGDTRISAETRRRIGALAAEAGYLPNAVARTLSGGRSGLVGLVLGPPDNPFYTELLHSAVVQAAQRGVRLLLLHAGAGPIEDHTAAALLQYQVDGCLITSAELSSKAVQICADHKVPVVMVNRIPRLHASAVACDNLHGAEALADALLAAGHRRFALVRGSTDTSTSLERERGFAEHVVAGGGTVVLRLPGGTTYAGGFAAGQTVAALPAHDRPDVLFAVADIMAMGAMDAMRLAGLHAPRDISVVGFDGIASGMREIYNLTTVAQPLAAMVGRGLDMLTARMADPSAPDEVVLLRGDLIRRGSARLSPDVALSR